MGSAKLPAPYDKISQIIIDQGMKNPIKKS